MAASATGLSREGPPESHSEKRRPRKNLLSASTTTRLTRAARPSSSSVIDHSSGTTRSRSRSGALTPPPPLVPPRAPARRAGDRRSSGRCSRARAGPQASRRSARGRPLWPRRCRAPRRRRGGPAAARTRGGRRRRTSWRAHHLDRVGPARDEELRPLPLVVELEREHLGVGGLAGAHRADVLERLVGLAPGEDVVVLALALDGHHATPSSLIVLRARRLRSRCDHGS